MRIAKCIGLASAVLSAWFGLLPCAYSFQADCEQKIQDAQGYFNTKRYPEALNALRAIAGNCPEGIREKARELRERIEAGQRCGSLADDILRSEKSGHDVVCNKLANFESNNCSDPRIKQLKSRIGGCLPSEEERICRDGQSALDAGNIKEARQSAETLKTKYPASPCVNKIISQIRQLEEDEICRDGQRALDAGNIRGARQSAETLKTKYPASPCVNELLVQISQLGKEPKAEKQSEAKGQRTDEGKTGEGTLDPYQDLYSKAKRYFEGKEYYRARRSAAAALGYKPGDGQAKLLISQIEQRITSEKAAVSQAISLFYNGKHEESCRLLKSLTSSKDASRQAVALSRFYLGANYSTLFLLGGRKDTNLRDEAVTHFRQSVSIHPGFDPPKEGISERVYQLFIEATKPGKTP